MVSDCPVNQCSKELADFLCGRQELITEEWIASVRSDEQIPAADTLTRTQLLDHLPHMFNDLADALREEIDAERETLANSNARRHGDHRWQQGYELEELLKELARVRTILVDHVLAFEEKRPEFRGEEKRTAVRRFHLFFEDMIARSISQYVDEQQAELRARNEHLRAVDESRLRLLRNAAHDLRNTINACQLTIVAAEESDEAARRELRSVVRRNLTHMTYLVADLLAYATLFDAANSPRMVSLRVADLFDELVAHSRAPAEAKGLTFEAERDPSVEVVVSDPTNLRQIGYNLLSNAVKYTERGRIGLKVRAIAPDKWALTIEDSGSGIPTQELEQIFSEYHRAAETAHLEGSGLGLAIVRRLVDLLHGEIRVESEVGQGSRFDVILPRR
ncbi:MAG: sensor histidine kinase [Chthoniobacterales bacterium]